jgi:hypothetical protein
LGHRAGGSGIMSFIIQTINGISLAALLFLLSA